METRLSDDTEREKGANMRGRTISSLVALLVIVGLFVAIPSCTVSAGSAFWQRAATRSAGGSSSSQLSAWVKYSVIGRRGSQTVYARLVDERGVGIANASVRVTVHAGDGATAYVARPTDRYGYTRCTFAAGAAKKGLPVLVTVATSSRGRTARATTCYRLWW